MNKCIYCNSDIDDPKNNNRKFCNNKCQQNYQHDQRVKLWKLNKLKTTKGDYQINSTIRRYLFDKYDGKCAKCGWCEINPVSNRCPLEVEHIDGNSENNNEDNLILLCPNCHSLTPTYKNLNRGKGRRQRMARYKKGKTF